MTVNIFVTHLTISAMYMDLINAQYKLFQQHHIQYTFKCIIDMYYWLCVCVCVHFIHCAIGMGIQVHSPTFSATYVYSCNWYGYTFFIKLLFDCLYIITIILFVMNQNFHGTRFLYSHVLFT